MIVAETWFRDTLEQFMEDPEFQAECFLLAVECDGTNGQEDG